MTENASPLMLKISSSSRGFGHDRSRISTEKNKSAMWLEELGASYNDDYFDSKEESDFEAHYARYPWPLRDITEPHNHDVLFGRGGGTNNHPGNKRYRQLVEERKSRYLAASRNEKPLIALEIVQFLREQQSPPGRFLQLNDMTKKWDDVGYKRAREKTSQALREKLNYAPSNTTGMNKVDDQGAFRVGQQSESLTPPQALDSDANSIATIPVNETVRTALPQPPQPGLPIILPCLQEQEILTDEQTETHYFPLEVPKLSPPPKQPIYREHSLTGYPLNDDDDELLPGNILVSTFAPERLIKRTTSHNAEKDSSVKKNLKIPRHSKRDIERQHSLADVYLPGARVDVPAEMFSSNDYLEKEDLPPVELTSTTNSDTLSMDVTSFPIGSRKQLLEMMKLPCRNDLSRLPEPILILPNETAETTSFCDEIIGRQLSEMLTQGCCVTKNTNHSSNYDLNNVAAKQEYA